MRVLVTGGAGFIGSHVLVALGKDGHKTALFDDFNDFYLPALKSENAKLSGAHVFKGDLRDRASVFAAFSEFRPDAVIHLGARAGVRPSLQQPQLYIDTNITGTLHVLEAMREFNVGRMVFGSSSSVYGCNKKVPFSESDPIVATISPYAATKVAGEQLCATYSHLYGMDIVVLRFFTVYGPRQRPDLAIHKFARLIANGQKITRFGDGQTRRDYTYVDDIVQGILRSLSYPVRGIDTFNLGEHRTVALSELIALIENALGIKAKIEQLPEQPGDVPITYANISKARTKLGYDPVVSIEDGIQRFACWFQAQQAALLRVAS